MCCYKGREIKECVDRCCDKKEKREILFICEVICWVRARASSMSYVTDVSGMGGFRVN